MAEQKLLEDQAADFECENCGVSLNEEKLYRCIYSNCKKGNQINCMDCGKVGHKRIKSHKFNHQNIVQIKCLSVQEYKEDGKQKMRYTIDTIKENNTVGTRNFVENSMSAMIACADAFKGYKVRSLTKYGRKLFFNALRKGKFSLDIFETAGFCMVDSGMEAAKRVQEGAFTASAVVASLEIGYHTIKLINGDINWQEYGRRVCKSTMQSVCAASGNIGGTAIGAALGSLIAGPAGTWMGGLIGGIIGAFLAGAGANALHDKIWPQKRQKSNEQMIKEAMLWFNFTADDIDNDEIFNEQEIYKRYREKAKICHPDRKTGSIEKFNSLSAYLGMLTALLDKDGKSKKQSIKTIKSICL